LRIGIGANTAVFSIVDGVLFKALPYPIPNSSSLRSNRSADRSTGSGFSPPDFETLRHHSDVVHGSGRVPERELRAVRDWAVRPSDSRKGDAQLFSVLNAVRRWGGR
jgi:hypothetical protein